jgi:hypothetical protein
VVAIKRNRWSQSTGLRTSILKNSIDRRQPDPDAADGPTIHHQHLRGPTYFQ